MRGFPKPIEYAKQLIAAAVQEGDVVLDATVGNGHDTLFLAKQVGKSGFVLGFDVQQAGIDATAARLSEAGIIAENVALVLSSHETVEEEWRQRALRPFRAAMFNLGYLPGTDKTLITQRESSLRALQATLRCMAEGGLLSVMCYPGHEGGDVEADAVVQWAKSLLREEYRVARMELLNAPKRPPFLIIIEKLKPRAK